MLMEHSEYLKLCKKCKAHREKLGVSQSKVAEEVGVTFKAISHFEHGRSSNMKILLWYLKNGLDLEGFYNG